MGHLRTATAATLVVEAGLAVMGVVVVHYDFTAEYGDITDSAWEG